MEAACDSAVLSALRPDEARVYAETILRSAVRPVPRSLCAVTSIDELKGRLTMLNLDHGRKIAGLILCGAITASSIAIAAPTEGAGEPQTRTFEKKIVVHEGRVARMNSSVATASFARSSAMAKSSKPGRKTRAPKGPSRSSS